MSAKTINQQSTGGISTRYSIKTIRRIPVFFILIMMGLSSMSCLSEKDNNTGVSSEKGKSLESDITVCYKSNKPSLTMYATRVGGMHSASRDLHLTLVCLQGLVNREAPSLFLVQDELDEKWLNWMKERGDIEEIVWLSPEKALDKFAPVAKGVVIVDTLISATFNTGTMLAGINTWLLATPAAMKKYSLEDKISKHSESDLLDMGRFQWKKDVDAYKWFYEKYYDQLSHRMCSMTDPYDVPLRDYMVEFKIPLFWVDAGPDHEEMDFVEDLLMKLPPNIPCMGWPVGTPGHDQGLEEHRGVILVNEYAKWQVCTGNDGASKSVSNLSVHSGTTIEQFQNPTSPVPELEDKVYISFIRTDGDGPNFVLDCYRLLWDDTITHGKFALGWQLGPTCIDLIPDALDWYMQHATSNDFFVNALTGIGYIHEENYATMYPEEKRKEIWKEYLQISKAYREKLNLSMLTTYWDMSDDKMEGFANIGFQGIFTGYFRSFITSYNNQVTEVNGVPLFSNIVDKSYTGEKTKEVMISDILKWTPGERPAFAYVSLTNWVTSLIPIEEVLEELGPEYVAVTPEQLVGLYRKSQNK